MSLSASWSSLWSSADFFHLIVHRYYSPYNQGRLPCRPSVHTSPPPIGQNSQQMSQEYISDSSNSKSISFLLPLVLLQGIYIDEVSQRSQRKRSRKCPASTISLEAYNYAIDGKDKRQYCHRRKKDFKSICFHLWSSGNIIVSQ